LHEFVGCKVNQPLNVVCCANWQIDDSISFYKLAAAAAGYETLKQQLQSSKQASKHDLMHDDIPSHPIKHNTILFPFHSQLFVSAERVWCKLITSLTSSGCKALPLQFRSH